MSLLRSILIATALLLASASTALGGDDADAARDRAIVAGRGFVNTDRVGADVRIRSITLAHADDALLGHVAMLPELSELVLVDGDVSPAGWKTSRMKGFKDLRTIDLSKTNVTDAGVATLKRAFPRIAVTH